MRKNLMKLASITLCFTVAAVMFVACGKSGGGTQTINVTKVAELTNLAELDHNLSGGNGPGGISAADYWANSYVLENPGIEHEAYVALANRNAEFKIAADTSRNEDVLTVFSVQYGTGVNEANARLYLFDEDASYGGKVIMYNLLQEVSALSEYDEYTAYAGPITGRTSATPSKPADERKLTLHFEADKAGTYTVTMHLVKIVDVITDGKVQLGDSVASHTIKFVVA